MAKFIIEHLEPKLFEWCIIEYENISSMVNRNNLFFTNIKNKKEYNILKNLGTVKKESVSDLRFKNICILDMNAKKKISHNDKNKFDYFVFGGILGDDPPQHRTLELIHKIKGKKTIKFETRNLGKKQMPTDTAVYVTKKILEGKKFNEVKFFDDLEIKINKNETVMLPYRYAVENGRAVISNKIIEYLKKKKEF